MSAFSLLTTSASTAVQTSAGSGAASSQILSLLFSLITVLIIIFLLAWVLKRFNIGVGQSRGAMKVLATLAMGRNERIVLVELGDKQLLLGVTGQNINLLHTFDEPIVVEESGSGSNPSALFQQKLMSFMNKTEK
ncbi:flagellar biosynthetic protein FliO [Corallincola platygyrae]|uniref:Flagellar protein n=1 Tax=Corallincola platygyrae TaxID=1193278 RepID=A0ABW4XIG3_9GAMM